MPMCRGKHIMEHLLNIPLSLGLFVKVFFRVKPHVSISLIYPVFVALYYGSDDLCDLCRNLYNNVYLNHIKINQKSCSSKFGNI